jgi:hypothetical protein
MGGSLHWDMLRTLRRALACLALAACGAQVPVTDSDKALFVRAADLEGFGFRFEDAQASETFTKTRQFDGTYELTYRFQSPESAPQPLFLHVNVTLARTESDAMLNQGATKVGLMIAFTKGGVEEREVAGVRTGKLTLLVKGDRPIGNVFSLQDGARSYLLIMSGLYVQDAALWHRLIEPKLDRLRSYAPEPKA